jgi:hypothetical protein
MLIKLFSEDLKGIKTTAKTDRNITNHPFLERL